MTRQGTDLRGRRPNVRPLTQPASGGTRRLAGPHLGAHRGIPGERPKPRLNVLAAMSAALDELRAAGHRFTDDDVVHLSPARFEHINPYGRYHFDPELAKSKGPLRPLRRS
jgi:hypothetical protein